jgi:hypothetical protein
LRLRFACALLLLPALCSAQQRDSILSREITEKADVLAYFPVQVGNRWIYEHEAKSGDPDRPDVLRWTKEIAITGHLAIPEGTVVLRQVRYRDVRAVSGSARPVAEADPQRDQFHYLIRGSYVYEIRPPNWDEKSHSLTEGYRKSLLAGDQTPAFFFPMRVGLLWAEEEREARELRQASPDLDPFYHWLVEGKGGEGGVVKMDVSPEAFHLVYHTAGGPTERWFETHVGVVGEWDYHSGTYWENAVRLKQFVPAAAPPMQRR